MAIIVGRTLVQKSATHLASSTKKASSHSTMEHSFTAKKVVSKAPKSRIASDHEMLYPSALPLFSNAFTATSSFSFSKLLPKSLQFRSFCTESSNNNNNNEGERKRRPPIPILHVDEFDINTLTFSDVQFNAKGRQFVAINVNGRPLRLQTPTLRSPFGLKRFPSNSGRDDLSIQFSFDNMEADEATKKMLQVLTSIESKILETAVEKKASWFPDNNLSGDSAIKAAFRSTLRPPKDPRFSPLWKVKLNAANENAKGPKETQIFLKDDQVSMEELLPHAKVTSIVELRGLWFLPSAYGISWSMLQAKIDEVPAQRQNNNSRGDQE